MACTVRLNGPAFHVDRSLDVSFYGLLLFSFGPVLLLILLQLLFSEYLAVTVPEKGLRVVVEIKSSVVAFAVATDDLC